MKQLTIILLLLSVFASSAAERITATITATNETVNGDTIVVNGTTRTWTNTVYTPSAQILTNSTGSGVKSNLLSQIGLYPFSGVTPFDNGSNSMKLIGASGGILTVTAGTWAEISYTTQAVVSLKGVRVPISGEPDSTAQRDIASLLVDGINNLSTNALLQSSIVASNLVGTTNAQTISGAKGFTNVAGVWSGWVSNSPSISGTNAVFYQSSGGTALTLLGFLRTSANAFFGSAVTWSNTSAPSDLKNFRFSLTSDPLLKLQVVTDDGTGSSDLAAFDELGNFSIVGDFSGSVSNATNANASTLFATGSIPNAQLTERAMTNASFAGTNNFWAGSDVAFGRYALTTLANGINDDIVIGTNVNIYVSGPSADFSIRGMAGGRDGKVVIIENDTGYNMTIAVEGGALGNGPTAGNRITSNTGADRATTGNGTAILKYNATTSRWKLISFDP